MRVTDPTFLFEIGQRRRRRPNLQFDDAINIMFTSGTTGHLKGATTLSHHNILNNGCFVAQGLAPGDAGAAEIA